MIATQIERVFEHATSKIVLSNNKIYVFNDDTTFKLETFFHVFIPCKTLAILQCAALCFKH